MVTWIDPKPNEWLDTQNDVTRARLRAPIKFLEYDMPEMMKPPGGHALVITSGDPTQDIFFVAVYEDDRVNMRLVRTRAAAWVVSISTKNGKPAGHELMTVIRGFDQEEPVGDDITPVLTAFLPPEWRFQRRYHNSHQFTEIIPSDGWLAAFIFTLGVQLERTNE